MPPIKLSFAAIACATDLQGFNNNKLDRRPLPATMMATKMIELESQEEAVETMIRVATVAHVRASRGLRLLAFAASLAAALVVVTNRQDHWGVTATFTMFQVWVAFVASSFVTAAYALLTAIFVTKTINTRWLHHVDLLVVNLQTAATAGAGAVGSIAMWGNKTSGWFAVCKFYRLYCDKGVVSLVLAFVAFVALGASASLARYPRAPPPPSTQ